MRLQSYKFATAVLLYLVAIASPSFAQKATNPSPADGAELVSYPITLSWNAPANATGYYLNIAPDGGLAKEYFLSQPTITLTSGFSPETTYYWRVDAQTPGGLFTGDIWSFRTEPLPALVVLLAPINNAVGVTTPITFQWEPVLTANSYQLFITQLDSSIGPKTTSVITKTTSATVDNLPLGEYEWGVVSSNTFGSSGSPNWYFSTHYTDPADQSTNPSPADGATTVRRSLVVSWAPAERALSYAVYFGSTQDSMVLVGETKETQLSIEGLVAGQANYWRVDAINKAGATTGQNWTINAQLTPGTVEVSDALWGNGSYLFENNKSVVVATYAAPGDINGDGFDDVVLGFPYSYQSVNGVITGFGVVEDGDRRFAPSISIHGSIRGFFGRSDWPNRIPFSPIGAHEFEFIGRSSSGRSLNAAGDLNGDGLYDLAVGTAAVEGTVILPGHLDFKNYHTLSKKTKYLLYNGSGAVRAAGNLDGFDATDAVRQDSFYHTYVSNKYLRYVPGNSTGFPTQDAVQVSTSALSNSIHGAARGAGDLNGDGFDDLLITAPTEASYPARVIFGGVGVNFTNLTFSSLNGANGFSITAPSNATIWDVASVGDFNRDGIADLLVVSYSYAGLIFGRHTYPPSINPDADADIEFLLPAGEKFYPFAISAGDVNGDGAADIALSSNGGPAYIIRGSTDFPSEYQCDSLQRGFRILSNRTYVRIRPAGDLNGDGTSDYAAIASFGGNANHELNSVSRIATFFGQPDSNMLSVRAFAAAGNSPQTPVGLINPETPIPLTRMWMNFEDGAAPDGNASTIDVTVYRNADVPVCDLPTTPNATVAWKVETNRENWTHASMTLRYHDGDVAGIDMQKLRAYIAPAADGPWRIAEVQVPMPHIHMIRLQIGGADFANGAAWVSLGTEGIELGDVNMNGELDISDIIAAREIMAGRRTNPESLRAADLMPHGGDGIITQDDINALIEMIIGN